MKILSLIFLCLALAACGKDDDKSSSSAAVMTNPDSDLRVLEVAPVPGASFARFYGNYKITACQSLAEKADVDYCSYSLVVIYGLNDQRGITLVGFRKRIENGMSEAAEAFEKADTFTNGAYQEEGDRLASVKRSFPAPNVTFLNETTIRKLSDGSFTLVLRDIFKTPEGKDNHDREYRLALARY